MQQPLLRHFPLLLLGILAAVLLLQAAYFRIDLSRGQWLALASVPLCAAVGYRFPNGAAVLLLVVLLAACLNGLTFFVDQTTTNYFFRGPGFELRTPNLDVKMVPVLLLHIWVNVPLWKNYLRRLDAFLVSH